MKTFNFSLIKGSFSKEEAINLITKMTDVKIRFHEDKIHHSDNEEDIKMRENRIKKLQKDLYEARAYIDHQTGRIEINSEIAL